MARSQGAPQVPFFRDPKVPAIVYQVALCAVLAALAYAAVRNAAKAKGHAVSGDSFRLGGVTFHLAA